MIKGMKFKGDTTGHACTKIHFKDYEISIAMDDSCGGLENFSRVDVKVFKDEKDVTARFFPNYEYHQYIDGEILFKLMKKINRLKGE